MKEHNEIDELFKDRLEHFRPDASHLNHAQIASIVGLKTSSAATVAKVGFLSKWGLSVFAGLTAMVAGTATVIVFSTDSIQITQPLKPVIAGTIAIQHQVPKNTPTFTEKEIMLDSGPEMLSSEHHSLSQSFSTHTIDESYKAETVAHLKSLKPGTVSDHSAINSVILSKKRKDDLPKLELVIPRIIVKNVTSDNNDPNLMVTTVIETADQKKPTDMQLLADHSEVMSENSSLPIIDYPTIDSTQLPLISLEKTNEEESRTIATIYKWPSRRFTFTTGLGYVPQKTNLVITQELVDSFYIFPSFKNAIERVSVKNEFMASLNYRKRLPSNFQLGIGFTFAQGGWKANTNYVESYLLDDGNGNLLLVTDTIGIGMKDLTFNSLSAHVFSGYDFIISDHLMLGTSIGLNFNQLLISNTFTDYSNNKMSTSKKGDFVVGVYGAADLMYRYNNLGFSVGATINGRSTIARSIQASDFYNNVSFGLNGGIHYFLSPKSNNIN